MDTHARRTPSHSHGVGPTALVALALFVLSCSGSEPTLPAVALSFMFQPPAVNTRAEPITPPIIVEVQDAAGGHATNYGGEVTLSINDTMTGPLTINHAPVIDGVATFDHLAVTVIGSNLRFVARAPGLASAISTAFEVRSGPAVKLAFTRTPNVARIGSAISPSITVEAQDAGGYRSTESPHLVSLSFAENPAGASLSGTLEVTTTNGIAVFQDVKVDKPGQGYRLRASTAALFAAVSGPFAIRDVFADITAGYFHACGLDATGTTYCWGDVGLPSVVQGGVKFTSISSGRDHRCGLTNLGAAYCWNAGSLPAAVPGGLTFGSIAAGYQHTCGVTTSGSGYCWGGNNAGEVGDGSSGNSYSIPQAISGGHTFAYVSAGRLFSCGVTTGSVAYCWGDNALGELGRGTSGTPSATPAPVAGGLTFASISAGGFHACALTPAGAAYCWGDNDFGQIGDAGTTATDRTSPVPVSGGLTFTSLSAGNRHTCALTAAGVAYCWGDNSLGMLGRPGPSSNVPVAVAGGLTFASVRGGRFHTCARTPGGEGYCWGSNLDGLLGGGAGPNSSSPVLIP
jgi:Regulator of Chromosome Condensation (RCC1) repeat protein